MGYSRDILTIAKWEVKRSVGTMGKNVLPVALILIVLLIAVTGFTAKSGLHLQDGIYKVGTDDPDFASLFSGDARFSVYLADSGTIERNQDYFDLMIFNGVVFVHDDDRGKAAAKTMERDYTKYRLPRHSPVSRFHCGRDQASPRYPRALLNLSPSRKPPSAYRARISEAVCSCHRPRTARYRVIPICFPARKTSSVPIKLLTSSPRHCRSTRLSLFSCLYSRFISCRSFT